MHVVCVCLLMLSDDVCVRIFQNFGWKSRNVHRNFVILQCGGEIFNLVYKTSPKTYAIYVENEWDGFITVTHTATGVAKCLQNKMFMMPLKNFCSETYCKRQRHLHERYPNIGKIPGIITAKQIKQIVSFNWQNKWTKSKIYYY